MRTAVCLTFALLGTGVLGGTPASAANICRAGKLTCATTMPIDGYCECTAHGATEGGTVVSKAAPRQPANSTPAGCGANSTAPGCR